MGISKRGLGALSVLAFAALVVHMPQPFAQPSCNPERVGTVTVSGRGDVGIFRVDDAYLFVSHMHVNADGAPDAYKPDGNGLSYTCDGAVAYEGRKCVWPGRPNWQQRCRSAFQSWQDSGYQGEHLCVFGFQVTGGRPVGNAMVGGAPTIQGPGDPAPGNYVSETSMNIPGAPRSSQRRYVNSREIPFIVLSNKVRKMISARLGDAAVVRRPKTGDTAAALYADTGPSWGLGEGSIRLHTALGNNAIMVRGGTERAKRGIADDVAYLIFTKTPITPSTDHETFRSAITETVTPKYDAWGGDGRMTACMAAVRE